MCDMSHVMCPMSRVTLTNLLTFLNKVVKLVGGGSVINGAYLFSSIFFQHFLYLFRLRLLKEESHFYLILSLTIVAVIDKAIYMHLAAAIGTANETSLA